jgi:FtsP/CotA-like multicopper oxidase with cupredoxin domain
MKRRDLLKLLGAAAIESASPIALPANARNQTTGMGQNSSQNAPAAETSPADFTLRIAPITLPLTANHILSTIGYSGTCPGPLLRMKEGKPVAIDVFNETDTPEYVHWHGLHIPADVDGVEEEGTPPVPPHGQRRYQFTPRPAGFRWYHSHTAAMDNLYRSTYTGQFGFLMIDSGSDPGNYDQELFLALRDWDPFFTDQPLDVDELGQIGPQPEKPAVLDTRPNGLEVSSQVFSINDKVLGAGDPIRVKEGDRVLMHFLNASAIEIRRIALPGHQFQVLALDGNPVPTPRKVSMLMIGPGERVDALVEMNQPGVWILGGVADATRNAGLGVVVEYAGKHREPQWMPPPSTVWDYTIFGRPGAQPALDHVIDMVFEKIPRGDGKFNAWLINGKQYPHENEFVLHEGARYRLVFHNRTDDAHPLHLHRHSFELVDFNGTKTAGVIKDVVNIPLYGRVTVDFVANQPGLTLFHCHIQQHMDYGFKALLRYA